MAANWAYKKQLPAPVFSVFCLALACFSSFFSRKWRFSRGAKCDEKWRLFERPALYLTDLAFFAKISRGSSI
jgi:hypothetical protein